MIRRSLPRTALAAGLLAAAAACRAPGQASDRASSGGDAERGEPGSSITADMRLDAGDYDGAAALFERELAARPEDRRIAEKLLTSKRLAAQRHAESAIRAAARNDDATALRHLARARSLAPDAPAVLYANEQLGGRLDGVRRGEALREKARPLVDTDPDAALEILAEARRESPHDDEIVSLLRRATVAADAHRTAQRAAAEWTAGNRGRALELLKLAKIGDAQVPGAADLRARIARDLLAETGRADIATLRRAWRTATVAMLDENASAPLRDRLSDALMAQAREQERLGRTAVAALFEIEAQRSGSRAETPAADRVRAAQAVTLVIEPFEDRTGGGVDGLRLARALGAKIAADARRGSMVLRVAESLDGPAGFPRLVVRGIATGHRVTGGRVVTETQMVRYQAGSHETLNPASESLLLLIGDARAKSAAAETDAQDAQNRLRRLEELPFSTQQTGTKIPTGDAIYQTKLATARADVDRLRRIAEENRRDEAALRERLRALPRTNSEPVWAEVPREVTTSLRTCQISAEIRVFDGTTSLLEDTVSASAEHRETVAPAVPEAGLPADPDEMPNDAEIAARAADKFANLASGRIRAAAERAASPLLLDGRAKERAGDTSGAAERYALYLLSTPEVATPERAAAARAVEELTGLRTALVTGLAAEESP